MLLLGLSVPWTWENQPHLQSVHTRIVETGQKTVLASRRLRWSLFALPEVVAQAIYLNVSAGGPLISGSTRIRALAMARRPRDDLFHLPRWRSGPRAPKELKGSLPALAMALRPMTTAPTAAAATGTTGV